MEKTKFDIYEVITNRIMDMLEQGIIPWEKPWTATGGKYSRATGKPYSLLNQWLLPKDGEYLTFNQVKALGGKVKKGEKSHMVVFWKQLPIKETDPVTGEVSEKVVPFLRYYNVFHVDQCEDIEAKHTAPIEYPENPIKECETLAKEYLTREGIKLTKGGDEAYYSPSTDSIRVPYMKQFKNREEYYETLFHEMTHSTGATGRLNRLTSNAFFGNEEYSKEELVAEIGSAAILNKMGIESEHSFRNTTAYIQSWLKALKDDKKLIVSATGKAEKAVNFIYNGK